MANEINMLLVFFCFQQSLMFYTLQRRDLHSSIFRLNTPGPVLKSKGMPAIFQKKDKKILKKGKKRKIFENLGKNMQNMKIF